MTRTMHRRRPTADRAGAWLRVNLLYALRSDHRWLALTHGERLALHVAVLMHADASGMFYPNQATMARESGVSSWLVQTMVSKAEQSGLLVVEEYYRPDGYRGSNIYHLDPALVANAIAATADSTGSAHSAAPTRTNLPRQDTQESGGQNHENSFNREPIVAATNGDCRHCGGTRFVEVDLDDGAGPTVTKCRACR